eukprot:jgi/Ulvmu1/6570/UM003_0207.1
MTALRWRAAGHEINVQSGRRVPSKRAGRNTLRPCGLKLKMGATLSGRCRMTETLRCGPPRAATANAPIPAERSSDLQSPPAQYQFPMNHGCMMRASVTKLPSGECQVDVLVSNLKSEYPCMLHWGLYRSSLSGGWLHPDAVVPPDSHIHKATKAMHTLLKPDDDHSNGQRRSSSAPLRLSFKFPKATQPCFLAALVYVDAPGKPVFITPKRGEFASIPVGLSCGRPDPLGCLALRAGDSPADPAGPLSANFSVVSRHAGGMILRILRLDMKTEPPTVAKSLNFALHPATHKTGDIWHIQVDNLRNLDTLAYAWEAQGELGWRANLRYAPGAPLLDPYATLARPVKLPDTEGGGLHFLAGRATWCMHGERTTWLALHTPHGTGSARRVLMWRCADTALWPCGVSIQ